MLTMPENTRPMPSSVLCSKTENIGLKAKAEANISLTNDDVYGAVRVFIQSI